jgi:hypothetical protein
MIYKGFWGFGEQYVEFYAALLRSFQYCLTAEANRNNDDLEGFGFRWDDNAHYPVTGLDVSS